MPLQLASSEDLQETCTQRTDTSFEILGEDNWFPQHTFHKQALYLKLKKYFNCKSLYHWITKEKNCVYGHF